MSGPAQSTSNAAQLLLAFAARTGLTSPAPPRRYLWTDAFAVCTLLGIARATGEGQYLDLALRLVDQVHQVLGRHRPGNPSCGWLSGLGEQQGAMHPTSGGLRIGKPLPERQPDEPFDDRLEWDRDGQYFHYLTKWMHALDQTARATRQAHFNVWARELADVAWRAFSVESGARMVWKMSSDLSRALVPSMGQHDPLDGLITCLELQATATELGTPVSVPSLSRPVATFAAMVVEQELTTADPLGIGGLLTDAGRIHQLAAQKALTDALLLETLLVSALDGFPRYLQRGGLDGPASQRLAFRELGLSIGLHALASMGDTRHAGCPEAISSRASALLAALERYAPLRDAIDSFWLDPAHQASRTWAEHRDINEVMLATSIAPDGFLTLAPVPKTTAAVKGA